MKSFNGISVLERTFITGESPIQKFGVSGGREDFYNTAALRDLWDVCIDAQEYIPSGKVFLVQSESTIVPGCIPRY